MELLQGTLDLLVLKALSLEAMHGWAVSQRIRQLSSGAFAVQQGSLYPALQRLELKGFITSAWRELETGRKVRFYSLSAKGRRHLQKETREWEQLVIRVRQVLETN